MHLNGDRIVALGRARDLASGTFADLGDCILMPGLINAHCHLDFTIMRGAILQQESFSHWVADQRFKRTLTDEDYLQSIFNGFAELRRWGTTAVFNIESFPELMVHMPPPPIRTWWFYELIDVRNRIHTEEVVAGALTFSKSTPTGSVGLDSRPMRLTPPRVHFTGSLNSAAKSTRCHGPPILPRRMKNLKCSSAAPVRCTTFSKAWGAACTMLAV